MQDTSSLQDNVLQRIFTGNSIVQRFGDINQAIFIAGRTEEAQQSFPGDCMVDLSSSKRFGCQIAHLCSPVSSVSCQILEGNCNQSDRKNSIILFDKNSIFKVLPTFGQLIYEELGLETGRRLMAKAIGFRKSPRTTSGSKYLPHDIGDYWPLFDNAFTKNLGGENFLLDYVIKARSVLAATGECREACTLIIEGLLRLAEELQLVDSNGDRITKSVLLRTIKDSPDVIRKRYDSILYSFCIDNKSLQADTWKTMGKEAIEFITGLFQVEKQADVEDFINWDEQFTVPEETENPNVPNHRNIYRYQSDGFGCDIEVTTIHSVKGETHNATLLLETCFKRGHDLRKTIPFLAADGNDCASADDSTKGHLKRIYVAMTRPRELLCMALLKDHLGPNKKAQRDNETRLRAKGWRLLDITGGS